MCAYSHLNLHDVDHFELVMELAVGVQQEQSLCVRVQHENAVLVQTELALFVLHVCVCVYATGCMCMCACVVWAWCVNIPRGIQDSSYRPEPQTAPR